MSTSVRKPLTINIGGKEISCVAAQFKTSYLRGYDFEWEITIMEDDAQGLSIGQEASIAIWNYPETQVRIYGITPNGSGTYALDIGPNLDS